MDACRTSSTSRPRDHHPHRRPPADRRGGRRRRPLRGAGRDLRRRVGARARLAHRRRGPRRGYGRPLRVSTGFGALATTHIPHEKRTQLQRSLVRSHAAGMGDPVEEEVVRALMLLRVQTLATGRTGIREETLRLYVALLNQRITPVVREYGSSAAPATSPRSRTARWSSSARGGHGCPRRVGAGRHDARVRGAGPGRPDSRRPAREGGPGPHQRHRRHARHAVPGDPRPARAADDRRHRVRDERRGSARHRRRLRR